MEGFVALRIGFRNYIAGDQRSPVIGNCVRLIAEDDKDPICEFIDFALGQCDGGKLLYFHEERLYVEEGDALLLLVPADGDSLTLEFEAVAVKAYFIDLEATSRQLPAKQNQMQRQHQ